MKKPKCPKCESTDYMRERRPDGDTTCQSCGYKAKSTEWDKTAPSTSTFRDILDVAASNAYDKIIEMQQDNIPNHMKEMLKTSHFFRGLCSEAFIMGMHFGKEFEKEEIVFVEEITNDQI